MFGILGSSSEGRRATRAAPAATASGSDDHGESEPKRAKHYEERVYAEVSSSPPAAAHRELELSKLYADARVNVSCVSFRRFMPSCVEALISHMHFVEFKTILNVFVF